MRKKIFFELFEKAYKITDSYPLDCTICPQRMCEDQESVMLLPYENEYIKEKLNLKKLPFRTIKVGDEKIGFESYKVPCPCYNKKSKKCGVYIARPIDCRTYPVVIYFTKTGKMRFGLADEYCPVAKKKLVSKEYISIMKKVWKMFENLLSKEWKEKYNELIVNKSLNI